MNGRNNRVRHERSLATLLDRANPLDLESFLMKVTERKNIGIALILTALFFLAGASPSIAAVGDVISGLIQTSPLPKGLGLTSGVALRTMATGTTTVPIKIGSKVYKIKVIVK